MALGRHVILDPLSRIEAGKDATETRLECFDPLAVGQVFGLLPNVIEVVRKVDKLEAIGGGSLARMMPRACANQREGQSEQRKNSHLRPFSCIIILIHEIEC